MNRVTRGETTAVERAPTGVNVPKRLTVTGAVATIADTDEEREADKGGRSLHERSLEKSRSKRIMPHREE